MKQPKNVIWITTDHMRFDYIRAHGNNWVHTPNLDRLVNNGVSFEHCYANNPLCMPSRCSFMTSCYPQQTAVMENGQELDPDFAPTVAHCFKHAGYRTVQIGKLHFENHQDHDLDPRPRNSFGFDIFQLSEEPGCYQDAYMTWLAGERPDLVETFRVPRPASKERHKERGHYQVLDAPALYSHSGWVGEQCLRYMGSWGRLATPQFIHLGFYAPHPPLNPTTEMFEPYIGVDIPTPIARKGSRADSGLSDETLEDYCRHFAAMITGVDIALGRLLEDLEQAGELDDTLIVFGSDHGDLCGDHGGTAKGTHFYNSVMHLPCVMHWPAGLQAGQRHQGLMEMVDVLPTMLDLCGIPRPETFQGISFADAMRNGDSALGREDVYAVHANGQVMLQNHDWKYLRYDGGTGSALEILYDLKNDPHELNDLAADPAYIGQLQTMRDRCLSRTLAASNAITMKRGRF